MLNYQRVQLWGLQGAATPNGAGTPTAPRGAVAVQLASLPPPIAEPGPAAPKPAAVAAELTPTLELQLSNGKAMGKSMGKSTGKWENLREELEDHRFLLRS